MFERNFEKEPVRIETSVETEFELELCLRRLTQEVVGRKIGVELGIQLVRQINTSHIKNTNDGALMQCLVKGCTAECILAKNSREVLRLISESGTGICEKR